MRTFSPKAGDIQRQWHVIDATDVVLGRLASQVAVLLRGKHKPIFAPHIDTGDFVVVVNADKVALTGDKLDAKRADAYLVIAGIHQDAGEMSEAKHAYQRYLELEPHGSKAADVQAIVERLGKP